MTIFKIALTNAKHFAKNDDFFGRNNKYFIIIFKLFFLSSIHWLVSVMFWLA